MNKIINFVWRKLKSLIQQLIWLVISFIIATTMVVVLGLLIDHFANWLKLTPEQKLLVNIIFLLILLSLPSLKEIKNFLMMVVAIIWIFVIKEILIKIWPIKDEFDKRLNFDLIISFLPDGLRDLYNTKLSDRRNFFHRKS